MAEVIDYDALDLNDDMLLELAVEEALNKLDAKDDIAGIIDAIQNDNNAMRLNAMATVGEMCLASVTQPERYPIATLAAHAYQRLLQLPDGTAHKSFARARLSAWKIDELSSAESLTGLLIGLKFY